MGVNDDVFALEAAGFEIFRIPREAVLARLPERLRDVAQWAIDRGLPI